MCESCETDTPQTIEGPRRRKKLWETDVRLHCSIIGTCLTLGELRRIASRLHVRVPPELKDYDIHAQFVDVVGSPGPVAKAMHKVLDRKYKAAIRRFSGLEDDGSLRSLWDSCLQDGDVPGPYWALATHPAVSKELIWHAFGEVHMLSHLVGASGRANIRRLRSLETERDVLAEELGKYKRRLSERESEMRRLLDEHAIETRDLGMQILAAKATERRLEAAEERIREQESGEAYRSMRSRVETLTRQAAEDAQRAGEAEVRISAQGREIDELRETNQRLGEALSAATRERESLEAVLHSELGSAGEGKGHDLDLCGQRIVYVGGRARLIPRLRTLVERANGTFIHHDGGIEERGERLGEVLAQGDVVLFPVDCVSHRACQLAKRLCKQRSKTFVPLRSSGLSSFVSGLHEIVSQTEAIERGARCIPSH